MVPVPEDVGPDVAEQERQRKQAEQTFKATWTAFVGRLDGLVDNVNKAKVSFGIGEKDEVVKSGLALDKGWTLHLLISAGKEERATGGQESAGLFQISTGQNGKITVFWGGKAGDREYFKGDYIDTDSAPDRPLVVGKKNGDRGSDGWLSWEDFSRQNDTVYMHNKGDFEAATKRLQGLSYGLDRASGRYKNS